MYIDTINYYNNINFINIYIILLFYLYYRINDLLNRINSDQMIRFPALDHLFSI